MAAWVGLLHLPFLQTSPQLGWGHLPSDLAALGHVGVPLLVPLHPALVLPRFPGTGERLPAAQREPAGAWHEANTLSHLCNTFCVLISKAFRHAAASAY